MKIKHIIWSSILKNWKGRPFDKQWVDHRVKLYKAYFLEMMRQQTEQDFSLVLQIREDFKYCIQQFAKIEFPGLHLQVVPVPAEIYPLAPSSLMKECENYDWVYYTRCDTDDMLAKGTVELLKSQPAVKGRAYILGHGFNYHLPDYRLAVFGFRWQANSTIVFPTEQFFNVEEAFPKAIFRHLAVKRLFDCHKLGSWHYCVLTHGKNTSTGASGHPIRKPELCEEFFDRFPVMDIYKSLTIIRSAGKVATRPYADVHAELETSDEHDPDCVTDQEQAVVSGRDP